tara:strand:- start:1159 stop:3315 length:2157 start_codon:yes stop_codon:yes gene_type:complete
LFETSFLKQLVLIGGGHANVQVLKKLSMTEIKGLNTILISENFEATYSGMTPGYIHNDFSKKEVTIDLQKLCLNAGATFIKDKVIRLESNNQKLELKNNPSLNYDLLSINTGSISNTKGIKIENDSKCISVKPISLLIKKIEQIDKVLKLKKNKITIIGGGVASFEIAFSLVRRYENNINIVILGKSILAEKNLNSKTKKELLKIANDLGIKQYTTQVTSISKDYVEFKNGEKIKSDLNLLSTGASLPEWLLESRLSKGEDGFITVDKNLLSISNKNIFVTGDACNVQNTIRTKSGVMAVRQGEILKENIFLKLFNKPLLNFKPQKNWLYLIGTYPDYALLNYFSLSLHSRLCWKLKVLIDKNFINKFKFTNKILMKKKTLQLYKSKKIKMYCQGCGSKVSKKNLINFLKKEKLSTNLSDSSKIIMNSKTILQTIDHIKHFNSFNPYDFGRISYLHSQNDILSAGGRVKSLSVSLAVPFSEDYVESFFLNYFMNGIFFESNKYHSTFEAGHSYHSNEPGITINMNGEQLVETGKNFANCGDLIYLTKPLGTGYLLSAYMENSNHLSSEDFKKIIYYLTLSNYLSAESARKNNCRVMTDVSGFGLGSHLSDISKSSKLTANISLKQNILINNNLNLLHSHKSTGFKDNFDSTIEFISNKNFNKLINILFDPQTNGPLIIIIDKGKKDSFEQDFYNINKFQPNNIGYFSEKSNVLINIID